jgi:DNA-binding MarR family transcriptional regulator
VTVQQPWNLVHVLSHAEHRIGRRIAALLATEGMSVETWRVLSLLADGAGHPMTAIADFALMPPPSLTKLVDRLVSDNLVYRRADPADRRRVLVHLTARGRISQQRAQRLVDREQAALLAAVGDAGDLVAALDRLRTATEDTAAVRPH